MPEPIPFSGATTAIGDTFPASVLARGRAEAERRGIAPADIDAVTRHDRRLAIYMLGQLGSPNRGDQTGGEYGLRQLIRGIGGRAA